MTASPLRADSSAQKYYYEDILEPFFVADPQRPGYLRSQRPESIESSFSAIKSSDTFRVFILGGSIATLLNEERAPPGRRAFHVALPGKRVELINCGMSGYESHREALIEQEILKYSPDLIILLTGHNEDLSAGIVPIWILKAQEHLRRWSAYRSLVATLHPDGDPHENHTDERADRRDATFSRNLRENIRQARRRGVQIAVVVPPRNYREPLESGLSLYDSAFVSGWVSYLRGDYDGAQRLWRDALNAKDGAPALNTAQRGFVLSFIGRSEEKLKRWEDARGSFEQTSFLDRAAICGERCQTIIRDAAGAEGALVVEADRMFRRLVSPRMPGLETFDDRMHWNARFNCLMWTEIIESVRKAPAFKALPWDEAALRATRQNCVTPGTGPTEEIDDRRTLGYALMDLSRPEVKRASPVSVFYLQAVRRNRPDWFLQPGGLLRRTVSPRAAYGVSWAPEKVLLPRLHWHLGEVRLLENDRAGAIAEFDEALRRDPSLVWAKVSRAVALGLSGDKTRAIRSLKDAISSAGVEQQGPVLASAERISRSLTLGDVSELHNETAGYWLKKAEEAAAAGRRSACLAALDKARGFSPLPAEARQIAQSYRRMKEPRKFLSLSDSLMSVYPEDTDLWISRAETQFEIGRPKEAEQSLARARALNPTPAQLRYIELVLRSAPGTERPKLPR